MELLERAAENWKVNDIEAIIEWIKAVDSDIGNRLAHLSNGFRYDITIDCIRHASVKFRKEE